MVKLIALFRNPEDMESFDAHYSQVHIPLAKAMPGLQKLEVTRVVGTPMGQEAEYYLLAQMYFADRESLDTALRSTEGRTGGKDLAGFAGKLVSMMIGEVVEFE